MLPRILETEVMDTLAEALDYDAMGHGEVNRAFVADLLAAGLGEGEILDLGAGTGLIPIELCRQSPSARVLAIDLSANMLAVARRNVDNTGLADRIRLQQVDGKRLPYGDGRFATVMSNSIVHHIPDPRNVLAEAWRVAAPGGLLFFRDLFRPEDESTLQHLVELYTVGCNEHQRRMFADSLHAALTVEEVRGLVADFGAAGDTVQASSDRHWTWEVRKS
jgi:ubiquinone/menaquinone biosynthesis C-methylase UbiE